MTKITFEDLPSTNTPLSASNLNTMQDNIEDAINDIGTQATGFGDILSTDGTYTANFYAKVVGTQIGNKLWKIELEGKFSNNNAGGNYYNWGISITKINTLLNLNLQNYTNTLEASSYNCFNTSGALDTLVNGIATMFEYKDTLNSLMPARYYDTSGSTGGWGLSQFPNNYLLKGTIYLKEV